jgi:nucleoside-diphosphate-sugar epimerase
MRYAYAVAPTYLVTGCAGFIGSHLTERLLADGHTVVGIDSFEDYYSRAQKEANLRSARSNPAFALVEANILSLAGERAPGMEGPSALAALVRECDYVYPLAAQPGVRGSWGDSFGVYVHNNVLATQQILEACRTPGQRLVYASSSSVYGDQDELPLREDCLPRPRSPYGVTKLAGEHLALLYHANLGVHTVALRFFTVYGPRQRPDMAFHKFIKALREGRQITLYGDGSQTRDFTYVDDIVEGLVLAQNSPAGAVMNIGGGNRVSLAAAIATLGEVMGVRPHADTLPVEAGDVRDTWADIDRATDMIGYRPTTSLAEGLAQEYAWLEQTTRG